jgi:protoporphyrinogen IX oxidase
MSEGWLSGSYLWVKAFHIIFVIYWMAGMFMLPRYFAYHAEAAVGSAEDKAWQERERRLMRIIINPSMILAVLLGLALSFHIGWNTGTWLPLKIALVLGLGGLHGALSRWRKQFASGQNRNSSKFYRMINEIPTIATIPIVLLVILKPF